MMALKNLHLVRVFENQGMLVQLLLTCLVDITPFLLLLSYFLFIIFYMYILAGANLGEEKDYPDMNPNLKKFTQVVRNSLGDVSMPDYSRWCKDDESCNPVFVGIIWSIFMLNTLFVFKFNFGGGSIFMFNLILVLVILLNFLISIIGQSYEKVWTFREIYIYRNKIELNCEYYICMKFLGYDTPFTSLLIHTPIRKIGE